MVVDTGECVVVEATGEGAVEEAKIIYNLFNNTFAIYQPCNLFQICPSPPFNYNILKMPSSEVVKWMS